jgi:Xaa-Pro aminopeptidase
MYLRVKAIKSENEMKIIRRLSEIGDLALNAAVEAMVPGVTELEVAGEAEYALRTGGMETIAYLFDTRVASGPRSGLKNALPSARKLQKGDMVYVDLSATYHGYALDCSRSTCVGKPNPEQEKMLETAVLMYDAVRGAAKPGVHPKELIKIARQTAKENGEEENFVEFVVAHGIGTCQVEIPRVNPISQDVLAPNMTFALEAMLVKTDFGTGCCEDIIAVTQNGSERLAKYETRCWPAGQSYL